MSKDNSSTIAFRVSADEKRAIQKNAGELKPGEYARRLALDVQPDLLIKERQALGKLIRAIHQSMASGIPQSQEGQLRSLLADALKIISEAQQGTTEQQPTEDEGNVW